MKEATGELSMVVITIIIVIAVIGIWGLLKGDITNWVKNTFERTTGQTAAIVTEQYTDNI